MDYGEGIAAPIGGDIEADGDDRLGRPGDGEDRESLEIAAAELEIALRMQAEAAHRHYTACRGLHIKFEDVTPDDLRRATLSDDMRTQVSRLRGLFTACGIVAEPQEVERADVIHVAAENAPQSETERQLAFQAIAAHFMALRSAGEAASGRHIPQVTALYTADFVKASKLYLNVQGSLQAMRRGVSPPPEEIHGHVHLHAGDIPPMLVGGANARPTAPVRPELAAPDAPDADASGAELP
jgi:hypothetical protein